MIADIVVYMPAHVEPAPGWVAPMVTAWVLVTVGWTVLASIGFVLRHLAGKHG